MPPRYRELPMDYAPFMPFGDGGLLFYTGRLFACGGECPDDASWTLSTAAAGRSVLVNGERHAARATWRDGGQGRYVYVGQAEPVVTGDVLALIDSALPQRIRSQLEAQIPRFMAYFTQKLGPLGRTPALFASYDVSPHDGRWGRQGGTRKARATWRTPGSPTQRASAPQRWTVSRFVMRSPRGGSRQPTPAGCWSASRSTRR